MKQFYYWLIDWFSRVVLRRRKQAMYIRAVEAFTRGPEAYSWLVAQLLREEEWQTKN